MIMTETTTASIRVAPSTRRQHLPLDLLRCPIAQTELVERAGGLIPAGANGVSSRTYAITDSGIPIFASASLSEDARVQEAHYERIAARYLENLDYPHTQEYGAHLDRALMDVVDKSRLDAVAEICCGRGEAFDLLSGKFWRGIGVDVSLAMLESALAKHQNPELCLVQGDATRLPLASGSFESVFMLGGIHHVNDRRQLFAEIARILRPGGKFYFREPVNDFAPWRWMRHIIYRVSPALDADTERPLRFDDTAPVLEEAGLKVLHWSTHGFIGFCLFMNSDVLVFNRLFRFLPGIRTVTRWSSQLDQRILRLPGLERAGLQVIGVAERNAP
jgi:ubiquinone/menaquinone biosynthesis C-methylase UbiE